MNQFTPNFYKAIRGFIVKNRRIMVTAIHLALVVLANYSAFLLRFDGILPYEQFRNFVVALPIVLVIRLAFYLQGGLYKDLWRYSSISDLIKIIKSVTFGSIAFILLARFVLGYVHYPRSIYILDWLLLILFTGGSRLLLRVFREYLGTESLGKKRTLIIGAGDAGEMIVRDMKNNPKFFYEPIGFIDDDPYKKGLSIHGIPIFGPRTMLKEVLEKQSPEEVLVAIPSVGSRIMKEIYEDCKGRQIPIKTLPAMSDIMDGIVTVSQIKPLALEDLLQREQVTTDIPAVKEYIIGKSVLVTGAGGSIGSELCRQIFAYGPSSLILFDRYENGLFDIDMELQTILKRKEAGKKSGLVSAPLTPQSPQVITVVGDMRDSNTLEDLFGRYKPQLVFHAAAHKHVPLMEHNPLEAVRNNIFGTRNLLESAARHKVERFVMISTDKAVNTTNVMGATKRVAEFMTMNMGSISPSLFTIVRFGNVLGSNGSVVRTFREQIKKGGPLTVTHPEIKRFFMLIPEAVQLVLISGTSGNDGNIFVLDMGEQIKITDLAENLISLSGFIPHQDIRIEFTGLRPGEKLYEELFDESERIVPAFHEKLRAAISSAVPSAAELQKHISTLEEIVSRNAADEVIPALQKVVPNFRRS